MIDFSKAARISIASGFKGTSILTNSNSISSFFSLSPGTSINILTGNFAGPIPVTIPTVNSNAATQVQFQLSGLESYWHVINGNFVGNYSSNTYQILAFYAYNATTLTIYFIIVNQSAGTVTVPDITFNCRAYLFIAPW